jgi:hypothetical protein
MSIHDRIHNELLNSKRRQSLTEAAVARMAGLSLDLEKYSDTLFGLMTYELEEIWGSGSNEVIGGLPPPTDPAHETQVEQFLLAHLSSLNEKIGLALLRLQELQAEIVEDRANMLAAWPDLSVQAAGTAAQLFCPPNSSEMLAPVIADAGRL